MADGLSVKFVGGKALLRDLDKMDPSQQRKIIVPALLESVQLTLRIAAREKILPGGKGKPRANKLTSRTGALRGSLSGTFSIDRRGLPRFIEGGTELVYGAVHENSPRAFLSPALADAREQFEGIFIKHWARVANL
jgi:hypothetical protein